MDALREIDVAELEQVEGGMMAVAAIGLGLGPVGWGIVAGLAIGAGVWYLL